MRHTPSRVRHRAPGVRVLRMQGFGPPLRAFVGMGVRPFLPRDTPGLGARAFRGRPLGSFAGVRLPVAALDLGPPWHACLSETRDFRLAHSALVDGRPGLHQGLCFGPGPDRGPRRRGFAVGPTPPSRFALLLGVFGLALVVGTLSPLAAEFFDQPQLLAAARGSGSTCPLRSLGFTHYTSGPTGPGLSLHGRWPSSSTWWCAAAPSSGLALAGQGPWSLVLGYLAARSPGPRSPMDPRSAGAPLLCCAAAIYHSWWRAHPRQPHLGSGSMDKVLVFASVGPPRSVCRLRLPASRARRRQPQLGGGHRAVPGLRDHYRSAKSGWVTPAFPATRCSRGFPSRWGSSCSPIRWSSPCSALAGVRQRRSFNSSESPIWARPISQVTGSAYKAMRARGQCSQAWRAPAAAARRGSRDLRGRRNRRDRGLSGERPRAVQRDRRVRRHPRARAARHRRAVERRVAGARRRAPAWRRCLVPLERAIRWWAARVLPRVDPATRARAAAPDVGAGSRKRPAPPPSAGAERPPAASTTSRNDAMASVTLGHASSGGGGEVLRRQLAPGVPGNVREWVPVPVVDDQPAASARQVAGDRIVLNRLEPRPKG